MADADAQPSPRAELPGMLQGAAGEFFVVSIPKALLVLTRREFIAALKRGKAWKRASRWQRGTAPTRGNQRRNPGDNKGEGVVPDARLTH